MNNKGFTLVELVVVMVLMLITGSSIVTVYIQQSRSTSELLFRGQLQSIEEVFIADASRKIRPSFAVLASNETYAGAPLTLAARTEDTIYVSLSAGTKIPLYAIAPNGLLSEYVSGSWKPFKSGNDTARVVAGSGFQLSSNRREMYINLRFFDMNKTDTVSLPTTGGFLRCRN